MILNLKKPVDRKTKEEYKYKIQAIDQIADILARLLASDLTKHTTFVPVPPSQCKSDPLYDDRLVKILEKMHTHRKHRHLDYRELVSQKQSTEPAHNQDIHRLTPDALTKLYDINTDDTRPMSPNIVIFDDVIAAGSHFKAMQKVLKSHWPTHNILGLFVARRAL